MPTTVFKSGQKPSTWQQAGDLDAHLEVVGLAQCSSPSLPHERGPATPPQESTLPAPPRQGSEDQLLLHLRGANWELLRSARLAGSNCSGSGGALLLRAAPAPTIWPPARRPTLRLSCLAGPRRSKEGTGSHMGVKRRKMEPSISLQLA